MLDRFDRRNALGVCMLGLVIATAVGGFATGLYTLLGARVLAGAFGGPATSVALAIVADVVPAARRGKAVGTVMSAFSIASILGVPAGLRSAQWFGWRAPFFGVAALGLVVTVFVFWVMPPLRSHLSPTSGRPNARGELRFDALMGATLLNTACVMLGVFSVIPNISTFLQKNLGYPRDKLDALYFIGGLASFFSNRLVGVMVDRFGATRMVAAGTVLFTITLYLGFLHPLRVEHVIFLFPLLMLSSTLRGVPLNTLASRVPGPDVRARFMSAQNAVQHIASAFGALGASVILTADDSGRLYGMQEVTLFALAISLLVPFISAYIERGVRERERVAAVPPGPPAPPSIAPP
jgi:predicted MFS family arabinose efflux permease